jgi:hypothetical protein
MVSFEISVNGERRFVGDDVRAITVVTEWITRRQDDRVSVHVGLGGAGERAIQHLGADLHPGDEITIRVREDDELPASDVPEACSFCGSGTHHISSLVAGPQVAICDSCLRAFDAVVTRGAALPVGGSIRQDGDLRCGFCLKGPPEVAGVLVRNAAAICPECLHACVDMIPGDGEP